MRRALALLLVAVLASGAYADRKLAEALAEAAAKALKEKDVPGALGLFADAVKADETYLAARRDWAEAARAAGSAADATRILHEGVLVGEALPPPLAPPDVEALMAMRRRLAELDAPSAAIEGLLKKHADALAALSAKWMTKDATFAENVARAALAAQPDHPGARDRLARIQRANANRRQVLFDGKTVLGWSWADPPKWSVKDGAIVATTPGEAMVIRTNRKFEGDFSVTVEARVAEKTPNQRYGVSLFLADDDYVLFGLLVDRLVLSVRSPGGAEKDLWSVGLAELDPPSKAEDWVALELQLVGSLIKVLANGKELTSVARPPGRASGYVALFAQIGTFHFRKIELIQR